MKASNRFAWSRTFGVALLTGVLLMFGAPLAWADQEGRSGIFPPAAHPYGMSYPQWAAEWGEWIYSIPTDKSPFLDPDGQFCHVEQLGPVLQCRRRLVHPRSRRGHG